MNLSDVPGATEQDYVLVSPYGLGDTYVIAALCGSFKRHHCANGERVFLVVRESQWALASRFWDIDHIVTVAEQRMLEERSVTGMTTLQKGVPFIVHPTTAIVRADYCVAHQPMSDVAMYAMILGLPPTTELGMPIVPQGDMELAQLLGQQNGVVPGHTVLMVRKAVSWPNSPDWFWDALEQRLSKDGYTILRNDPAVFPLNCVPWLAEMCGWVIGANCGLMQTFVAEGLSCRKTIITEELTVDYPLPVKRAFPYRRMYKISGHVYDIEEFVVDSEKSDYHDVIEMIAGGRNACGPEPSYEPLTRVEVLTTPGDIVDKLSIIAVKIQKMPDKAHMLYGEWSTICYLFDQLAEVYPKIIKHFDTLLKLNETAWDENQFLIDNFLGDGFDPADWDDDIKNMNLRAFMRAHHSNQERIKVKNLINEICGAGSQEVKSYDC